MCKIAHFIETLRCNGDVRKMEKKLEYLTDEEEIKSLNVDINLRKALNAKDYYMYRSK